MAGPSNNPNVPLKDKLAETFNNLKKKENVDDVYSYAKANKLDTISYIVLIIGIILLFFNPFWGGILIGAIAGLYFSQELTNWVRNLNEFIEDQGLVRSIIIAGTLLGLFIAAPMIFIAAAAAVLIKQLIAQTQSKK